MGYKSLFYIVLLPIILLLLKWGSIFFYFENISLEFKYFLNFYDKQYFPLIKSLSELNFSPTYNDYYTAREVLSFPYASIIFHSILFQVFDLNMIIIAELIFYTLGYLLVYYFLNKSGLNKLSSLATTILIFFSPVFLDYINFFFEHEGFERIKTLIFEYHLNSHRFPRPLVTDLYFYLSLIILINLVNNKLSENKDYVLLGISLSLLLQSFIYLFLVVGFAFILVLFLHLIANRDYFKKQFKSLILLLIIFLIFTTPFVLQSIFAEQDYIKRIGLFSLDFEQKKFYLKIQLIIILKFKILFIL